MSDESLMSVNNSRSYGWNYLISVLKYQNIEWENSIKETQMLDIMIKLYLSVRQIMRNSVAYVQIQFII